MKKIALLKTTKRESETRWSARADSVDGINNIELNEVFNLLKKLVDDENATNETKGKTDMLLCKIFNY